MFPSFLCSVAQAWLPERVENGLLNISHVEICGICFNSVSIYISTSLAVIRLVAVSYSQTHPYLLSLFTSSWNLKPGKNVFCKSKHPSSSRCRGVCPGMLKAKRFWNCSFIALETKNWPLFKGVVCKKLSLVLALLKDTL